MQKNKRTTNFTAHIQHSAQGTNVPNNQTEHIQNNTQGTNVTNSYQNTYKTVRETPMWQTVNKTHTKQCARH